MLTDLTLRRRLLFLEENIHLFSLQFSYILWVSLTSSYIQRGSIIPKHYCCYICHDLYLPTMCIYYNGQRFRALYIFGIFSIYYVFTEHYSLKYCKNISVEFYSIVKYIVANINIKYCLTPSPLISIPLICQPTPPPEQLVSVKRLHLLHINLRSTTVNIIISVNNMLTCLCKHGMCVKFSKFIIWNGIFMYIMYYHINHTHPTPIPPHTHQPYHQQW